jgi:hypothetical protein
MSQNQNAVWRDTPDLVAEVWLELTSNHGHEGKDFEVHLKWGHIFFFYSTCGQQPQRRYLAAPDTPGNIPRAPYHRSRPIAIAIPCSSPIRRSKSSGERDCGPSHKAWAGSG